MRLIPLDAERKLRKKGLWPESWTARAAIYVLALDVIAFAGQILTRGSLPTVGQRLGGWVSFLSGLAILLLAMVGFRWLRAQLLWRLRNRLIVTYVFIGVIPVFLLVVMSLTTLYLLVGQFAGYVMTTEISAHLHGMQAANKAVANELTRRLGRNGKLSAAMMAEVRALDPDLSRRQVCAWEGSQSQVACSGPAGAAPFDLARFVNDDFEEIIRDRGALFLRTATVIKRIPAPLVVISSEPFDKDFMGGIAKGLGEIILLGTTRNAGAKGGPSGPSAQVAEDGDQFEETFTAGVVPPPLAGLDLEITFPAPLHVRQWPEGVENRVGALVRIRTRLSVLYGRLFAALGDYAQGIEYILLMVAIGFGIIVLLALYIGTRLTQSVTGAVAELYEATTHINRADFAHRIKVQSTDQLAALANSFNSMTTSLEKLIQEQKEKQRMENELAIAQEVQATLFPRRVSQLEALEVHGFCRPARTVSGDYYDFLALNSEKVILAMGDVSGKGISAALLMATIHSAVRAYSLEGVPLLREPVAVGAAAGSGMMLASDLRGGEVSPGTLLALLNHQLYESTPMAKYATLFLGIYDSGAQQLTYSNGGHLPPILISADGSREFLTCGGTVIGLFDNIDFPEASVKLNRGDIFVAYSDGVTEPENDYGEFGEERLIEIVRQNRRLPLERITELVTAAVDDWIGDNEQPDDVTLVLARAR